MCSLPPKPRRSSPASSRSSPAQAQRGCQFKNWHPYPSLVSRVQECTFYEDYRLVLLCSQRAFMMAVTGTRIWVWNKPCYFSPGCKVYSGDQTHVLLPPMRCSVSGMRGGGHLLTQAGVAAEGLTLRHEGIFTSMCSCSFISKSTGPGWSPGSWITGQQGGQCWHDTSYYLAGRGLSWWGAGTSKGSKGLIWKKRGAAGTETWHYCCAGEDTAEAWVERCFFAV